MASQKYVARRHALILQVRHCCSTWPRLLPQSFYLKKKKKKTPPPPQGFTFLWRYMELRGECQESVYNLGRALHQLGLSHLAIHYYQKALELPPEKLEVGPPAHCACLRESLSYGPPGEGDGHTLTGAIPTQSLCSVRARSWWSLRVYSSALSVNQRL